MATAKIQFADGFTPATLSPSHEDSVGLGGVYSLRERRGSRASAHVKSTPNIHEQHEPIEDEDAGLHNEGDFKHKQTFSTKQLLLLSYQSIGVIYGDIGTSPLYVYSSTFTEPPRRADLLGALSLIVWSLFIMVTIKYVLIILRADNEGEGGTFSTYALLSRFANISNRDPREASLVRMQRYKSGELGSAGAGVRHTIEGSRFLRNLLKIVGVLAVSMVIADGVLTPAQSVLGAVQGLNVAVDDINKSTIVGTTCGILILLFMIQPFGVGRISLFFAPVVIIWLAWNAVFGIYNLAKYDHTVLKGFNPYYAIEYLVRNGEHGWRSLGGILLAFTGLEALYADLGAFTRQAVQLSWLCYAFPCLLLAYVGQAAYISHDPEAYSNPFFNAAPRGTVIPSLVIAVLAAIVASQAMITATFQLLAQLMKLSYFPQIKVVHTSKTHHGQVYIPIANWLMMIGTVLIAAIYNNTTSLGNAYGVCVIFVTFFDTCMVTLAAMLVWRFSPYLVFLPWLIIACIDGTFLSAALAKVPDGAWFTLTLSAILAAVFILWRFGKEQQWFAEAEDRFPSTHFVTKGEDGCLQLTEKFGGTPLSRIAGLGIFFDKAGETTPIIFSQFIRKLTTLPAATVFFHLRPLERPTVAPEERYHVSRLAIPNCYRLIVRHGYTDEIITPDLAALIYEKIREHIVHRAVQTDVTKSMAIESTSRADPPGLAEKRAIHEQLLTSAVDTLDRAFKHEVLYIIGKEQMRVKPNTNILRRAILNTFLFIRDNTRTKIASLKVQRDRVIEVGFIKDV